VVDPETGSVAAVFGYLRIAVWGGIALLRL
jgi:hypothetical protein